MVDGALPIWKVLLCFTVIVSVTVVVLVLIALLLQIRRPD